ncbi:hypothetical protein ACFL3V_01985 [Nanoarchaeota archaeon]
MLKRGSHYICMFLIYLLIMPVLHSAGVFADMNANAYGMDNIPSFRRSTNDVTILNVSASIAGEEVTPLQIRLIGDPSRVFQCSQGNISETVFCTTNIAGDIPPGPRQYGLQLYRQDGSPEGPQLVVPIMVDGDTPNIHSFYVTRNESNISVTYSASDTACSSCAQDTCAGISRVAFLIDYVTVGEVLPEGTECLLVENWTTLDVPQAPGTTQERNVCMEIFDRLGQRTQECKNVTMDFSLPTLLGASVWVGNRLLKYSQGDPISNVRIQVNISEDEGLNISTIVADFSGLNYRPEFADAYKNVQMSDPIFQGGCHNISTGLYGCNWTGILAIIPDDFIPEVRIIAEDINGNKMNSSVILPVIYDDTQPEIVSIRSGIADDNARYWVGAGNNSIYVDIIENESGFSDRKLFLDFSSFGEQTYAEGHTNLFPNNCTEGWMCNFNNIVVDPTKTVGDILSLFVTAGSTDNARNMIRGVTSAGFYYDPEPPEIISVVNSSICPTALDEISIAMNVSEHLSGGVKVEVSASRLSTNNFPMEFDCEESDVSGVWLCDFEIDNLVTIYTDDVINITVIDRAGNRDTTSVTQEVCESTPGTPPNVVSVMTSAQLPSNGLDRKIASGFPHPFFYTAVFLTSAGQIQDMKMGSCTAENASIIGTDIVSLVPFTSALIGTKIQLAGIEDALTVNELVVTCDFSFIIRSGTKVYELPEEDTVTFGIPLYNFPLGYVDQAIFDKIEDIDEEIDGLESTIDALDIVNKIFGTFCTLGQIIEMLVIAMQVIKAVAAGLLAWWWPSAYQAICMGLDQASNSAMLWAYNPFILAITIPASYAASGIYIRLFCAYYTCELIDSANFIESITYTGAARGNSYRYNFDDENIEPERNAAVHIPFASAFSEFNYDPYRSVDVAWAFVCIPGILYNYKKSRQLKCLYRKCILDRAAAGFSTDVCDELHKIRECIYIESAPIKAIGWGKYFLWIQALSELFFRSAVEFGSLASLVILGCPYLFLPVLDPISARCYPGAQPMGVACGGILSAGIWLEMGKMADLMLDPLDLNRYSRDLEDPDFCSTE